MNELLVGVLSWVLSVENIPWLPGIYTFSCFLETIRIYPGKASSNFNKRIHLYVQMYVFFHKCHLIN